MCKGAHHGQNAGHLAKTGIVLSPDNRCATLLAGMQAAGHQLVFAWLLVESLELHMFLPGSDVSQNAVVCVCAL